MNVVDMECRKPSYEGKDASMPKDELFEPFGADNDSVNGLR